MRVVRIVPILLLTLAASAVSAKAQAVAFQPVVGSFPNGAMMSATPSVSFDRRYVRLGVDPRFNALLGFDTYSVPGAVSGGGPGGNANVNVVGAAGMNGLIGGAGVAAPAARAVPRPGPEGFSGTGGGLASSDGFGAALEAASQLPRAQVQAANTARPVRSPAKRGNRRPAPKRPTKR